MLNRRQQGVTLIELLIGIVILAGMLAMAVPAFSSWIRDTQTAPQRNRS